MGLVHWRLLSSSPGLVSGYLLLDIAYTCSLLCLTCLAEVYAHQYYSWNLQKDVVRGTAVSLGFTSDDGFQFDTSDQMLSLFWIKNYGHNTNVQSELELSWALPDHIGIITPLQAQDTMWHSGLSAALGDCGHYSGGGGCGGGKDIISVHHSLCHLSSDQDKWLKTQFLREIYK